LFKFNDASAVPPLREFADTCKSLMLTSVAGTEENSMARLNMA
jgi:hypothetical protein